jgi:hypothetical protein
MESIPPHVLDSIILGSQIVLNLVEVGEYSVPVPVLVPIVVCRGR